MDVRRRCGQILNLFNILFAAPPLILPFFSSELKFKHLIYMQLNGFATCLLCG